MVPKMLGMTKPAKPKELHKVTVRIKGPFGPTRRYFLATIPGQIVKAVIPLDSPTGERIRIALGLNLVGYFNATVDENGQCNMDLTKQNTTDSWL
jgi:hypothetical protein